MGWVKGSFFKQRRFHDREDLQAQLRPWLKEVNNERPSRATGVTPQQRRQQELPRLRPLRVAPERLAPRLPIQVGVTAEASYDGRYQAQHPRYIAKGTVSCQPEHSAAQVASVSVKRGRRYLQHRHLLETGEAALQFLTALVHRAPRTWFGDVEVLHQLLQQHGPKTLDRAFRAAVAQRTCTTEYIVRCLNGDRTSLATSSTGAKGG